jgi:hypothetical protein
MARASPVAALAAALHVQAAAPVPAAVPAAVG